MLPDNSADRLSWWTQYWSHRRELRHDRWKRRDEQRARLRDLKGHRSRATALDHADDSPSEMISQTDRARAI
jgi:hypothetical protein